MNRKLELYKDISNEILNILSCENIDIGKLSNEIDKRQILIDELTGNDLIEFRKCYKKNEIFKLDEELSIRFKKQVLAVKKEISDYRLKKVGNSAYVNMNKNNLNIFYKKV